MQGQAPDLVRSVVHAAIADHRNVAISHNVARQRVTNVTYALSVLPAEVRQSASLVPQRHAGAPSQQRWGEGERGSAIVLLEDGAGRVENGAPRVGPYSQRQRG